jgi:hypothetical protein
MCEDGEKPMIKIEPELKKRAVKRSRADEPGITICAHFNTSVEK